MGKKSKKYRNWDEKLEQINYESDEQNFLFQLEEIQEVDNEYRNQKVPLPPKEQNDLEEDFLDMNSDFVMISEEEVDETEEIVAVGEVHKQYGGMELEVLEKTFEGNDYEDDGAEYDSILEAKEEAEKLSYKKEIEQVNMECHDKRLSDMKSPLEKEDVHGYKDAVWQVHRAASAEIPQGNRDKGDRVMSSEGDRGKGKEVKIAESNYQKALDICNKEQFCFFDEPSKCSFLRRFNGKCWESMPDDKMGDLIYSHMSEKERCQCVNVDSHCKHLLSFIKHITRENYYRGQQFQSEDFDSVKNCMVFQNCVFDTEHCLKLPFDSNKPYTMLLDAEYIEKDIDTPFYDILKRNATDGDDDSMKLIDHWIGYSCVPNRTAKAFAVCANAKDSGKTVLGNFICSVFADQSTVSTIDPDMLGGRFSLGNVGHSVMLSCLEMNTGRLSKSAVAQLKKLTGEQTIRSEAKYQNEQTVAVRCKLLFATNSGLYLPAGCEDDAFYRRVIVLPFINSIPLDKIENDLPKRLQEEKSAILSKIARGLHEIVNPVDGGILFRPSALSIQMKSRWVNQNLKSCEDSFIDECLISTFDQEDAIPKSDIMVHYNEFFERFKNGKEFCSKVSSKNLMVRIRDKYPNVCSKKLRRKREGEQQATLCPCLTNLKWSDSLL